MTFDGSFILPANKGCGAVLALLLCGSIVALSGCKKESPVEGPQKVVTNPATGEERERSETELRIVVELQAVGGNITQMNDGATVSLSGEDLAEEDFEKLVQLDDFEKITVLYVDSDKLTDDTIATFAQMPDLERIQIRSRAVTDVGFAHIAGLTKLVNMDFRGSELTDECLAHLAGLTNLRHVGLTDTKITGTGLTHLTGLPNLESISLDNAPVTDAAIDTLLQMTNLKELRLFGTQVTDAGVIKLRGHKNLATLAIGGTQVSRECLKRLLRANPKLRIY